MKLFTNIIRCSLFLGLGLATLNASGGTPNITLNTPARQLNVSADSIFTFSWQSTDPAASAAIALYLDANNNPGSGLIPIISGIQNGSGTSYVWQASAALAGTNYYVYATMTDGTVAGSFAAGRLQIDPVGAFQLLSSIVATNASYVWEYAYDGTNYTGTNQLVLGANVISVTNGTSVYQFIVTRVPSLAQVEAVQYNPLNQITATTNGNGIVTTLTYDPMGRLVQRKSSNGALVTYGYDVLGNRTNMTDYTGATFYGYDGLSRLTNIITSQSGVKGASDNLSLSYEYDLAGQETAIVYPGGERIQYTYDNAGRLATVNNVTRNLLFQYTYKPVTGQLTKLTRPNGIETDYAYDGMGRLTNILHQFSATKTLVAQYGYTLDAIGKALLLTTTLPGGVIKLEQYGYDYFDRLTNVIYGDGGIINTTALSVGYVYDNNGNRLTMTTKTNNAVTEIRLYTYGFENRLLTVTNQNGLLLDAYAYDAAGNRIQKITTNYTAFYAYDERNLMTSYGDTTNQNAYTYNGDAERVSETLNAAQTIYVNDANRSLFEVVQERNNSGDITTSHTFGLTQLATWNGEVVTFELNDRLNSIRLLTDANGNVIRSYNYDVFGWSR
jgi:YD repeat-containing protein